MASERQQQMLDSAKEFMTEFSIEFLKMYGLAMFNRISEQVLGQGTPKKLTYRDWKSIERPDVFSGEVFMRTGEGPGTFGGWKKVFVVESKDYNLFIYPDEKSYKAGKKPKTRIRIAGYTVVRDASRYYRKELEKISNGLGMSSEEMTAMTTFSPYTWALAHPWRRNFMFQLHKGKGGGACSCFGGGAVEPEDAGQEFADERKKWLQMLDQCTTYASPRDLHSVTGRAFALTVGKMKSKFSTLSGFSDDGEEAEILLDMLLDHCFTPLREDMLSDLKGPVGLKIAMWYKLVGSIQKVLQGVADPVWGTTQKGAQKLGEKMEPQVQKGVEPILKVKEDIKQKIKDKLIDRMGEFLQKHVAPHIKPMLNAFEKPMKTGFEEAKSVFQKNVEASKLPSDTRERNLQLDSIPRTRRVTKGIEEAADGLVAPLEVLKQTEIFAEIDTNQFRNMTEMAIFETLDAAINTFELRMNEREASDDLKDEVIRDFDHDVQVSRSEFISNAVKVVLILAFRKAIGPVADPVIEELDSFIPEDVKDFVSVAALFEELVDFFVGEPIVKMVEGVFPKP